MASEKSLIPVKIALECLPEEDRPDYDEYVEYSTKILEDSLTVKQEYKGHIIPPIFTAESVKWQYDNWNPTANDVLVSTYPKTGKKTERLS